MRVHLVVEQDDGTLMGLSSEAALVEIDREIEVEDVFYGVSSYARPTHATTRLVLVLHDYTVFRPDHRPWHRPELEERLAVAGPEGES